MSRVIDRIIRHEGFGAKPYQDHLGNWTFGNGLTFITKEESLYVVTGRVHDFIERLHAEHEWLAQAPNVVVEVVVEMCFQMGWDGCHDFVKMWAALEAENYSEAAAEMLDSEWVKQTPDRAKELAAFIRTLDESSNT